MATRENGEQRGVDGGQKRRLRGGGAREARPGNRANTGGTGKKIPTDEWLGFWVLVEAGGLNIYGL